MGKSAPQETPMVDRILKIVLIVLILFLLLNYFKQTDHELASEEPEGQRGYSLDRVNEHILMTQDSIEIEGIKARDQVQRTAPELRKTRAQRNYNESNTLSLDYDQSSEVVSEDLGRSRPQENDFAESPAELIQNDIYQRQRQYETEVEFTERKKQQIIANARAKGYEIELDDRGERIIRWKKIKPNRNEYRSPSGSSAR